MPIREPLGDGTILEFPDGTPPAVIASVKARVAKERGVALAPAAAATEPAKGVPLTMEDALTSVPGRAVAGAVMDRIDPMAETLVRAANVVGAAPDSEVKRVQGINRERSEKYDAARKSKGQEGWDIARILGPLALDVGVTRGLAPKLMSNPQSTAELAKSGAVVGGVSGAMAPTRRSEDMSNAEFFLQKSLQSGVGAGVGAGVTPVVAPLAEGVAHLAVRGVEAAKRALKPSNIQRLMREPAELEAYLQAQARAVGVDFAAVPEDLRASMRDAATRAIRSTNRLPDTAVRNRMLAEKAGLPQLTVGQATRDPVQFSREANLADEEFRSFLGGQQTAATKKLQDAQAATPGAGTPYEAGTAVIDDVAAQRKIYDDRIQELYEVARKDPAGYQLIQNTQKFAKEAVRDLKQKQLWENLPKVFKDQLAVLTADQGRYKLSARQAANLLKNINAHTVNGVDPTNAALGVLKTKARELVDNAEMRDPVAGAGVLKAFKDASAKRAERGSWEDSSTAVKNLASKTPVAAERVFEKYVMQAPVDDFQGLWKTLGDESRTKLQRQFVDTLVKKAMNKNGTELTNYGTALQWLREFPPEKLKTMFPDEEALKQFKTVLEYVRLTKEAPPGNFVNRSNSGVMLLDALASTRNWPAIGPAVTRPLGALREEVAAKGALAPDLAAPGQAEHVLPVGVLEKFGRSAAPYVVPGALGALGQ